jgi:hypothetical protein
MNLKVASNEEVEEEACVAESPSIASLSTPLDDESDAEFE